MRELHNVSIDIVGGPGVRGVPPFSPPGGPAPRLGRARSRDVPLVVPPAARLALIGRNGAGKTTTLRTLMGLLPPRAGRVVIDGQDATAGPPHHRARLGIGYAPEERRLFGSFSVRENMLLPA